MSITTLIKKEMENDTQILKTLKTNEGKKVDVSLSYNIGGMNYFTGQSERRGYYCGVTPFDGGDGVRTYTGFSGAKALVLEVKRKSKSAEEKAINLCNDIMEELIEHVCRKNTLTIKKEEC